MQVRSPVEPAHCPAKVEPSRGINHIFTNPVYAGKLISIDILFVPILSTPSSVSRVFSWRYPNVRKGFASCLGASRPFRMECQTLSPPSLQFTSSANWTVWMVLVRHCWFRQRTSCALLAWRSIGTPRDQEAVLVKFIPNRPVGPYHSPWNTSQSRLRL